mmetsp:Transcript_1488/g.5086  ORF Transcript_1488/g.5086 Transcript_1488/m.5086 type:complete len:80 (-) Transcript_1488:2341-2580(-)
MIPPMACEKCGNMYRTISMLMGKVNRSHATILLHCPPAEISILKASTIMLNQYSTKLKPLSPHQNNSQSTHESQQLTHS